MHYSLQTIFVDYSVNIRALSEYTMDKFKIAITDTGIDGGFKIYQFLNLDNYVTF